VHENSSSLSYDRHVLAATAAAAAAADDDDNNNNNNNKHAQYWQKNSI